ncbi:MAG: hypothetical protein LUC98_07185 [Lachnospiraceae bacterium]|nr:hypothetical protein [Lachnospiraceae bacterium]
MPRTRKENVFPNYIRVKDTDQEALAELTIKAKGGRSLSRFARDCGVNPSTLSRLVNQRNSGPCADKLIKAIADNAQSDSGVTLDMLLEAHGLAPIIVQKTAGAMRPSEVIIQMDDILGQNGAEVAGPAKMIRQAADQFRGEAFEREAGDIIINALIRKGYTVRMEKGSNHGHFDIAVETDALHNIGVAVWLLEIKTGFYSAGIRSLDKLFQKLYFNSLYDEGKAASLVIADKQAFEDIREKYHGIEIHDYVSVILIDRIKRCVADEFIFKQKGKSGHESILLRSDIP